MSKIEHVVVLMLENRSFDNVLGRLHPKSDKFDGLAMDEWNPWHKDDGSVARVPVWSSDRGDVPSLPDKDPGEFFTDITMQIYGLDSSGAATMDGFVDNYVRQPEHDDLADPKAVMHVYRPEHLPATTLLARSFGVSDRWFASAPCETWPNRYFLHCGTAGGYVNNPAIHFSIPLAALHADDLPTSGSLRLSMEGLFPRSAAGRDPGRPMAEDPDALLLLRSGVRSRCGARALARLQFHRTALLF